MAADTPAAPDDPPYAPRTVGPPAPRPSGGRVPGPGPVATDGGGPGPTSWDLLELPPDPPRRGGRRGWLLAAGVVPWLVVGALALRGGSAPAVPAPSPTEPSAAVSSPTAPAAMSSEADAAMSSEADAAMPSEADAAMPSEADAAMPSDVEAVAIGTSRTPGPAAAAAVAAIVARDALGGSTPLVEIGAVANGDARPYVEHVLIEDVDLPVRDAGVVTVLAILLHPDGDAYPRASLARLAVPIRLGPTGARPAGSPWVLAPPDITPDEPAWEPIDDPTVLADAGAALVEAGYRDVEVRSADRRAAWPIRVTADAVAPGESARRTHTLWLRDDLGDLVVAGWPGRTDAEERP